jgi:hypothetical protein
MQLGHCQNTERCYTLDNKIKDPLKSGFFF